MGEKRRRKKETLGVEKCIIHSFSYIFFFSVRVWKCQYELQKECVWCDKNILLNFISPHLILSSWPTRSAARTFLLLLLLLLRVNKSSRSAARASANKLRSQQSKRERETSVKSKSWIFNLLHAIISHLNMIASRRIHLEFIIQATFIPFCLALNLPAPSDLVFPIYLIKAKGMRRCQQQLNFDLAEWRRRREIICH